MANVKSFVKVSLTSLGNRKDKDLTTVECALLEQALKLIDVDDPEYIDRINLFLVREIADSFNPVKTSVDAYVGVMNQLLDLESVLEK